MFDLKRPTASPSRKSAASQTSIDMLRLFLTFLETRCAAAALPAGTAAASAAAPLLQTCRDLLGAQGGASHPSWPDAYRIERELVLLQDGPGLEQTVRDLLDRADAEKNPDAVAMRKSYEALLPRATAPTPDAAAGGSQGGTPAAPQGAPVASQPAVTRAQLVQIALNILEKLQWAEAKRYRAVPLRRHAIHRVVGCGFLSFVIFVAPYLWSYVGIARSGTEPLQASPGLPLWTALSAGLLGAFFSRLGTLQSSLASMSLEDVEATAAITNLLLRGTVGMLGAMVVFFFLKSGLILGTLFPDFAKLSETHAADVVPLPNAPLALLVMWSFIAGFSERLVPNILAKTEAQMEAAAAETAKNP